MGKNLGLFHQGTPKTAFLIRNLRMDTGDLGIYLNKQDQFPKKSRAGLPILPGQ